MIGRIAVEDKPINDGRDPAPLQIELLGFTNHIGVDVLGWQGSGKTGWTALNLDRNEATQLRDWLSEWLSKHEEEEAA